MGIFVNVGIDSVMFNYIAPAIAGSGAVTVMLFKNNHTVTAATQLSNLTEADFPGYAQIPITAVVASGEISTGISYADFDLCVFTRSSGAGSQTVYGWALADALGGNILAAGNFAAPILVSTAGQQIFVSPRVTSEDVNH